MKVVIAIISDAYVAVQEDEEETLTLPRTLPPTHTSSCSDPASYRLPATLPPTAYLLPCHL